VCITANQPDAKSNPNPNPTAKQHAMANMQLNIVTCPTYPEKFIRDHARCCAVCTNLSLSHCRVALCHRSCVVLRNYGRTNRVSRRWLCSKVVERSLGVFVFGKSGLRSFRNQFKCVSVSAMLMWSVGIHCRCIYIMLVITVLIEDGYFGRSVSGKAVEILFYQNALNTESTL